MLKINVCRDCQERHPACHDRCEKYQEAKRKVQEEKEKILTAMQKDAVYADYKRKKSGGSSFDVDDFFEAAIRRTYGE